MTDGTPETLVAFALAALPGVIVLEIFEYGRPRIRDRTGVRGFAIYLILSFITWIVAVAALGAADRLADVIDLGSASGDKLVDAYLALSWRLLAAALGIGFALRFASHLLGRFAYRAVEAKRKGERDELSWAGDLAVALVSVVFAWDELLARLRRSRSPQIVHVRFRDGSETYGVFAEGGRADFQADGRGLVLDAELAERDGELVQIVGSSGVFVAADAVASVGFIEYVETEAAGGPATIGGNG